jgi:membrane protein implicated in regulation of membrane protease activity
MENNKAYENFPIWIPLLACVLSLSIYALGAYIFWLLGIAFMILYIIFCLWIELRIFKGSCVNCYYYGKICGLGRGKLCAMLFKKGNPERFIEKEISWKDLIPDFLVLIFPLVGGIIILIRDFTWLILFLMVILVMLYMAGNAVIRGSLACKYCKQKELGCPAEQLFNKGAKTADS